MKASDWIKVEDRLPEEGKWVLIYYKAGVVGIGYLGIDGWISDNDEEIAVPDYWQEIVPPKEDLVIEDKAEYTCKHCDPYCGQCYIKSYSTVESIGTVHYNLACTGKCEKYENED